MGTGNVEFKTALKKVCLNLISQRIHNADSAMHEAQASANSQEKSSVGDKYETSRAMGQIDRDMNAAQLAQARADYKVLETIPVNTLMDQITPGAVFELGNTTYFVAIGLGTIYMEDKKIIVISSASPLFKQLKYKQAGDKLTLNTAELQVTLVY